jgi:hypothetical protein
VPCSNPAASPSWTIAVSVAVNRQVPPGVRVRLSNARFDRTPLVSGPVEISPPRVLENTRRDPGLLVAKPFGRNKEMAVRQHRNSFRVEHRRCARITREADRVDWRHGEAAVVHGDRKSIRARRFAIVGDGDQFSAAADCRETRDASESGAGAKWKPPSRRKVDFPGQAQFAGSAHEDTDSACRAEEDEHEEGSDVSHEGATAL